VIRGQVARIPARVGIYQGFGLFDPTADYVMGGRCILVLERIPPAALMLGGMSHIGIAVPDVEVAARGMVEAFSIGPFRLREVVTPRERGLVHGEPRAYTLRFAYARVEPITLELIQPVRGETIYDAFLATHGPGLHHIGFPVGGLLDDALKRWTDAGYAVEMVHRRPDPRHGWAYIDTGLGFRAEILCDPPVGWWETSDLLARIEACRAYDGECSK